MLTIAGGIVLGVVILCLIPPILCGLFCAALNAADKRVMPTPAPPREPMSREDKICAWWSLGMIVSASIAIICLLHFH